MLHKQYHLQDQPIPEGFQIYDDRLDVAGLSFRRDDAINFCLERERRLVLSPEPGNPKDPNAIRVMGLSKGWIFHKRRLLGYVPKDLAKQLAKAGLTHQVQARLLKTYVGNDDYVEVQFQIIGPASLIEQYREAGKRKPRKAVTS